MGTKRMTLVAAVLSTVAAAGMMGCQQGKDKGSASVNVNALSISDVDKVTVSVQGAGMASPLTVRLTKKGSQFSAVVSDLPVGTDYAFTASAKDPNSVELYHGGVTGQSIIKNQTANIVIDMNQVAGVVAMNNQAPVIDSITATSLSVSNSDTVTINATAHDPDPNETALMAWTWDSTCGTLSPLPHGTVTPGNNTTHGASQITFVSPATGTTTCVVNLTVTDANGVLQNKASLNIAVNPATATGNAKILAILDTYPVISGLNATPVPLNKGVATTLTVTATDADGDALNYQWSSSCVGVMATSQSASTTFVLDPNSAATSCDFVVVVNDGNYPDGTAKGGVITNHLSLPVFSPANNSAVGAPVFGFDFQSQDTISHDDVVSMAIIANQGCAGGTISLAWASSDNQVLGSTTPAALGLDATLFNASAATYTAPAGAEDGAVITITVTATCSSSGLSSAHQFILVPLNSFCFGKADNTDCTAVANGANKCVSAAKCMAGVCQATTSVTCTPNANVCVVNTCDPADGTCKLVNASSSTPCDDHNACTTGADLCSAGTCHGTTNKDCSGAVPAGVAGACLVATCDPANAACGTASKPENTTCSDSLSCTTGDKCTAGVCSGTQVVCSGAQVCIEPQGPTCQDKVCMQASYADSTQADPVVGMALSSSGTPWVLGTLFFPLNLGSGTVTSTGSADIYLATLDPNGVATATYTFGDPGKNDQLAAGVAVASSGNVGVIGAYTAEIDFDAAGSDSGVAGTDFLSTSTPGTAFYVALTSAGAPIRAHNVDLGGGSLVAIGSNPTKDAFVVCGEADKVVPQSSNSKGLLTTTSSWVTGNGMDIVVAKLNADGTVAWGKQIGGAGDQLCESATIDNNGDVIIGGKYNGTLNFGAPTTAFPVVDNTKALIFVAKFNGTTGAAMVAQSWGTTGRSDANAVSVDGSNNILLAGSISGAIDFGGGVSIPYLGLTDAYVAKFTSALVPVWAKAYGDAAHDQSANGVAADSSGNVFFGGTYSGSLGALGLSSASPTSPDGFLAELSPDGTTLGCARTYGDAAGTQGVLTLSVARASTNALFAAGSYSSSITFGNTLTTPGAGSAYGFVARLTP